jgi:hypothetical protein
MACVYILTNETIPGLLKIGYTGGTAADRAAEISRGTGVPSPYTVHWFIETTTIDAAYAVEQSVHQALKRDRHNRAREFFTTSLPVAIDIIQPASAAAVIENPKRAPTFVAIIKYVEPIRQRNIMTTTAIPRIVGWKFTARSVDNIRDLSHIQR